MKSCDYQRFSRNRPFRPCRHDQRLGTVGGGPEGSALRAECGGLRGGEGGGGSRSFEPEAFEEQGQLGLGLSVAGSTAIRGRR